MSRVISINQSEPGLYLINVQRSRSTSVNTLMRAIANPPVDDTVPGAVVDVGGNGHANSAGITNPARDTKQQRHTRR